jgi:hypothetical protein
MDLFVAPHGPPGITPNLDLKGKHAFESAEKGLSHYSQLSHAVFIWSRITVKAIPVYTRND